MAAAIAGTTLRISTPGQGTDRERGQRPGSEADPGQFEILGVERAVAGGEERVVEPPEQLAERGRGGGQLINGLPVPLTVPAPGEPGDGPLRQ
jgi:hypothetical protein